MYKVGYKYRGEWSYIKVDATQILETISRLLVYSQKVSIAPIKKEVK
jgi:hypothetical protein